MVYILHDRAVQTGRVGDDALVIAAKAICSNKRLILVNGTLYYVHQDPDYRKIELHPLCDGVKEEEK